MVDCAVKFHQPRYLAGCDVEEVVLTRVPSCIAAAFASVAITACTQGNARTSEQIATAYLGDARVMFLKDGVEAESRARAASVARFATADDCYSSGTDRTLAWDQFETYTDLEVCLLRGARDVARNGGGVEAADSWLSAMGFDVRTFNFDGPDRVLVEHRAALKAASGQTPARKISPRLARRSSPPER